MKKSCDYALWVSLIVWKRCRCVLQLIKEHRVRVFTKWVHIIWKKLRSFIVHCWILSKVPTLHHVAIVYILQLTVDRKHLTLERTEMNTIINTLIVVVLLFFYCTKPANWSFLISKICSVDIVQICVSLGTLVLWLWFTILWISIWLVVGGELGKAFLHIWWLRILIKNLKFRIKMWNFLFFEKLYHFSLLKSTL